jgi:hypothetical protein
MPTTSPQNGWNHLLKYWPGRRADDSSGPFWWTCVVFFTVMAALIALGALAVLAVKLLLKPELPRVTVESARLDVLNYDWHQRVLRDIQLSVNAVAENRNAHAELSFSEVMFNLTFDDTVIMSLASGPFDMPSKSVHPLNYTARSTNVLPLDGAMEDALNRRLVPFILAGEARTHWKEGGVVIFKSWTRLFCNLSFYWPSGTAEDIRCTSVQAIAR